MDMRRVLELVASEHVTMLTLVGDASAVPLLDALEDSPGAVDTGSLLMLGSGGSLLTAEAKARLMAALPTVLAITEAIGSSEAPVQGLAITTRDHPPAGSLEFQAKDITAVFDDELRPVAPGSGVVGRLATRGRVPVGYHNDPDKSAATFVDVDGHRWSLPGDMATIEADGTIRLLGRGAMCINTGGEKVYPDEVEAVLKGHPEVVDAVVVGVPDPRWGERVAAVIQPSHKGAAPTLSALQDHCRVRLAGYKVPRVIRIVPEVVRNPAGKADYRWARDLVLASLAASE